MSLRPSRRSQLAEYRSVGAASILEQLSVSVSCRPLCPSQSLLPEEDSSLLSPLHSLLLTCFGPGFKCPLPWCCLWAAWIQTVSCYVSWLLSLREDLITLPQIVKNSWTCHLVGENPQSSYNGPIAWDSADGKQVCFLIDLPPNWPKHDTAAQLSAWNVGISIGCRY